VYQVGINKGTYGGSLLFTYNLKGRAWKMQNLCVHRCANVHSQVKGCNHETQTHKHLINNKTS